VFGTTRATGRNGQHDRDQYRRSRPALLAVRGGSVGTLVRRECLDDLFTREADLTHPAGDSVT
jgi:hypothetical protein